MSSGEKSVLVKFVILFKSHNTTAERNGNKYSRTARMNKLGAYRNIDTCGKQLVLIVKLNSLSEQKKKMYRCPYSYKIYILLFDRIYVFWTISLF